MGPRVLFVTCHLPYPSVSGGRLREFELIKRLSGDVELGLRVVSKTYEEDLANARHLADLCTSIEIFPAEPDLEADGTPLQIARHRSPALTRKLQQDIESGHWDMVHVEGFYLMPHVPRNELPLLLVEQNIEYSLWRQRTGAALVDAAKKTNLLEYLHTLRAEMNAWEMADMVATVTEDDRAMIVESHPHLDVRVVPDGSDHLAAPPTSEREDLRIKTVVYIANFAYQPNVDGVHFLCNEIFPRVRSRVPDARLLLVGNDPPDEVVTLAEAHGGLATGRVPDVTPYLTDASVVVCPLRIGGGIKVKVLEALRHGKALVTTSVGAQGLGDLGGAAVVADDARSFAAAVRRLLTHPAQRRALESKALAFSRRLPTWDHAAGALMHCYRDLIARSARRPALAEDAPREAAGGTLN